MYSSSSEWFFIALIIAIPILLILIAGFVLSIVVFFTKRKWPEVLAWIFNSFWFIFDMFMLGAGVFEKAQVPNFFIFPILITFFLLLQHRSNLSSGSKLRTFYIIKSSLILVLYFQLSSQVVNLITRHVSDSFNKLHFNLILPVVNLICVLIICVLTAFNYLKRTRQELVATNTLKNAAIFLICATVCAELIAKVIGLIEILSYGESKALFISQIYLNPMNLLITLGYCLLCTILGSLIAGYTYLYYAKREGDLPTDHTDFAAGDQYPDIEEK
jgi:hypothetical protein